MYGRFFRIAEVTSFIVALQFIYGTVASLFLICIFCMRTREHSLKVCPDRQQVYSNVLISQLSDG
jgi:hypothetical protein